MPDERLRAPNEPFGTRQTRAALMPKPMEAPDNNEFAATLAGLVSSGQNEGVWRDLVNALPAAIYITDPRGRIIFYNEAAVPGSCIGLMVRRCPMMNALWRSP